MEISYLREFILISREKNISNAAKLCFLCPSALSRHLKYLEKSLGLELVERNTHFIQLTDAGQELLEKIEPLVTELENVLENASVYLDSSLRITVRYTNAYPKLYEHLNEFRTLYPKIEISCNHSDNLIEDLLDKKTDMIIDLFNPQIHTKGLSSITIDQLPIMIAYSNSQIPHMSTQPGLIFNCYELVIPSVQSTPGIAAVINSITERTHISPNRIIESDSFENTIIALKSKPCVALIPANYSNLFPDDITFASNSALPKVALYATWVSKNKNDNIPRLIKLLKRY